MGKEEINIREFAERVERLCEFIFNQVDEKDGSPDLIFVHKLREDAADIQFNRKVFSGISLIGLDNHARGILKSK